MLHAKIKKIFETGNMFITFVIHTNIFLFEWQ